MTGWVLVLVAGAYYGNTLTVVPGYYASQDACRAAASAFVEDMKPLAGGINRTGGVCIPGPTLTKLN